MGCFAGDVHGKWLDFFCMRRRMGTAKNEIGEGESVCLWAEGKIVFLLHSANEHSANTNPNSFIKQGLILPIIRVGDTFKPRVMIERGLEFFFFF